MTKTTKSKGRRKEKETYGVLLAADGSCSKYMSYLNYVDLKEKNAYYLAEVDYTAIGAILTKGRKVYFDADFCVRSLFGGFESEGRPGPVESIQKHRGKILDAGPHGLFDTLENKVLIPHRKIARRNIREIPSLLTDRQGNLYAFARELELGRKGTPAEIHRYVLVEINSDSGNYSLGKEILSYEGTPWRGRGMAAAAIVPYGNFKGKNGKEYPFSVLSCANLRYLDLNGEKIEGTEVWGEKGIRAVEPLKLRGDELEVVYSGQNLEGQIIKAKIDLRRREIIESETYRGGFDFHKIYALEPVTDESLHKKLIKKGEFIRYLYLLER